MDVSSSPVSRFIIIYTDSILIKILKYELLLNLSLNKKNAVKLNKYLTTICDLVLNCAISDSHMSEQYVRMI